MGGEFTVQCLKNEGGEVFFEAKINRVLGPKILMGRARIVRVEASTADRDLFVSVSLTPKLYGIWRSYREVRATLCGVQIHYRETAWRAPNAATVNV